MRPLIAALLILTVATNARAQEGQGVTREGPSIEEREPTSTNDSESHTQQTGWPVTIVETPEQSANTAEREKKADDHEAADLDAQVRAANAAERSAATAERQEVPAWAQIVIGSLATVIAVIALISSLWTAIAGIRTTRAQTRAYVHIEKAELRWGGRDAARPQITLYAKNTGATPAKWFAASYRAFTMDLDKNGIVKDVCDIKSVDFRARNAKRWNALGGGDQLSFLAYDPDDTVVLRAAYGREDASLNIAGIVRYETFFGEIFETEFWFVGRPVPKFRPVPHEHHPTALAVFGEREAPATLQRNSCVLRTYVHVRHRWWSRQPRP